MNITCNHCGVLSTFLAPACPSCGKSRAVRRRETMVARPVCTSPAPVREEVKIAEEKQNHSTRTTKLTFSKLFKLPALVTLVTVLSLSVGGLTWWLTENVHLGKLAAALVGFCIFMPLAIRMKDLDRADR